MMKKALLIWLSVLGVTVCLSQSLNIDSLKSELNKTKEDTNRVLLLRQLTETYIRFSGDTALFYALDGYNLAQKIKYERGELLFVTDLARCWWSVGEYATALQLLLPKIKEIESTDSALEIGYAYATIADCYRDMGAYDEALKYHFKGAEWLDKRCFFCRIFNAAIASDYIGKKLWDSAQSYIATAFTYPAIAGLEGWPLYIRGKTYDGFHNSESAFLYYRQSVSKLLDEHNLKDLANVYNSAADLFIRIGQKDSARFYAHHALELSFSNKFAKEAMEANLLLSQAYESLSTDSALHYYRQAVAAKDSLYNQAKQRQILSYQFQEQIRQQQMENADVQLKNRIKIYVLLSAVIIFLVVGTILWRNNRLKRKANILLLHQKEQTEYALKELKSTQAQLVQSEKMASLGELTAGIAHEIQNPLNFVNNFSEVNKELVDELKSELATGNRQQAIEIADDIKDNSEKINHHGKRADAIVKGMLQHSRASSGQKEPTDINALADEYLRLAYHGFRAKDKSFNAKFETDLDTTIEKINLVPQDIGRVLLNLINNAFYAVDEKKRQLDGSYEPCVSISTRRVDNHVEVGVKDNGNGIPQKVLEKIFQPFFTTKPTGAGTGLGLSLSYDIIKAHGGELKVNTVENDGSEFIIRLPV